MVIRRFMPLLFLLLLSSSVWAKPWVVAHRGGVGLGPENRLQTFEKAVALGVDAIELDIHQSQDGHLMVIHDNTLDRTFGRPGRVDRMTLVELREVGVPTLQDAIDTVAGRCRLVVEIKQPGDGTYHEGIESRLLEMLKKNKLVESSVVISFYPNSLRALRKLDPTVTTGFLYSHPAVTLKKVKEELGVQYIGPHFLLANKALIEQAHSLQLKVSTWTVNEPAAMRQLIESKCDAITTNYPDKLLKELEAVPSLK
jgi:glycerophosphoryl diester phosphodiesterase